MRIVYFKNGKKHTAQSSNSDFTINEERVGNRTIIKLTAKEDVVLHKADVSFPFHTNFKDLYFLRIL